MIIFYVNYIHTYIHKSYQPIGLTLLQLREQNIKKSIGLATITIDCLTINHGNKQRHASASDARTPTQRNHKHTKTNL